MREGFLCCILMACAMFSAQTALACSQPRNSAALSDEIVRHVNRERQRHGLRPLSISGALQKAAERHACDMSRSGVRSHTGSDGSTFARRYRRAGGCGPGVENIAWGQRSPGNAVQMWMNSPGHRDNILHRRIVQIGIGVSISEGKLNWVMVGGRGC